ncbi:Pro-Pol polyprotein [Cyphomyrmex costatus]|uniref:Pro-Pol polyprotein n=1 Tax=Cyphomyrmex costatus TaxID=456900 RepID=A0A151IPP5_9HYME|nr:Pro-Pol polyprotein [Cyphomyrmex costatus]
MGPLPETFDKSKHILAIIDSFTRFTWLFAVETTSTSEVIEYLTPLFDMFGNPDELVTDRGTAFTSDEFAEFLYTREVKHRQVAVAAPWANGLIERVNRFLKSSLKKLVIEDTDWSAHLPTIQYVINNTFHSSIKNTPSKLFFGYDQRNHSDSKFVDFLTSLSKSELHYEEERNLARQVAIDTTNQLKQYNKVYYDRRHKTPTKYKLGDYVSIRDHGAKSSGHKKFKPLYHGPYMISKILDKNRYVVTDIPGFNLTSKPYNSVLSPHRLKYWIKPLKPPLDDKQTL